AKRRSKMARRVGSASAPKVALSRSEEGLALVDFGTIWFSTGTGAIQSRLVYHVPRLPRSGDEPDSLTNAREANLHSRRRAHLTSTSIPCKRRCGCRRTPPRRFQVASPELS